jgi:hypothetical protein
MSKIVWVNSPYGRITRLPITGWITEADYNNAEYMRHIMAYENGTHNVTNKPFPVATRSENRPRNPQTSEAKSGIQNGIQRSEQIKLKTSKWKTTFIVLIMLVLLCFVAYTIINHTPNKMK